MSNDRDEAAPRLSDYRERLAALRKVVAALQARGYAFELAEKLLGLLEARLAERPDEQPPQPPD